jgi:hypothetical protein
MRTVKMSPTSRAGQAAIGTALAASAVIVYGAYGDPDPKSDQQAAVPFLVAGVVLVAAFIYGWLIPRRLNSRRTALALSLVGLLLVPVVFWTGLPVVLGSAGALLAWQGRTSEPRAVSSAVKDPAVLTGAVAIVANIAMIILSNTLL